MCELGLGFVSEGMSEPGLVCQNPYPYHMPLHHPNSLLPPPSPDVSDVPQPIYQVDLASKLDARLSHAIRTACSNEADALISNKAIEADQGPPIQCFKPEVRVKARSGP